MQDGSWNIVITCISANIQYTFIGYVAFSVSEKLENTDEQVRLLSDVWVCRKSKTVAIHWKYRK